MNTTTTDVGIKTHHTSFWDSFISAGQSSDAKVIMETIGYTRRYFEEPISHTTLQKKFDVLISTWSYNNKMTSSVTDMVLDPSYQEIIGMGERAIPMILNELQKEPNHLFWALKSITGIDPVNKIDRGNVRKMTDAWLQWGQRSGYIS